VDHQRQTGTEKETGEDARQKPRRNKETGGDDDDDDDDSLSGQLSEGIRIGHNLRHELRHLLLLQRDELLHARPGSHQLVHELPEFSEARTVLGKSQRFVPTNDLATHHDDRSIRVNRRFLIEQIDGGFGRIEDDEILTQHVEVYDFAYGVR
jgi:hypothetical protein